MNLQKRLLGIGGSDVAAILGVSKFKTAVEVWEEKVNKIIRPDAKPDDPATSMLYWGKAFEPAILRAYAEVTKNDVISGDELGQLSHPEHPWLIANVDGFALTPEGKILVEVKNCEFTRAGEWGENYTDVIPLDYQCQVQHYLHVTGLKNAHVAARVNRVLSIYSVSYSDAIIKSMMPILNRFWNYHVKENIPPKIVNFKDVKIVYKDCVKEDKEASHEKLAEICKLRQIKSDIKSLLEKEGEIKKSVAQYMGGNARLVANDGSKLATFLPRKDGIRVFRVF